MQKFLGNGTMKAWKPLTLIALAALTTSSAVAECQLKPSDTTFGANPSGFRYNGGPQLDSSVDSVGPPSDTMTIAINRVVGSGAESEFDAATGFLKNWQTYVDNGVVSKFASLDLQGILFMDSPGFGTFQSITIWLNGQSVKTISGLNLSNNWLVPACVDFETQYIKFAHRVPGKTTPDAVLNTIGFTVNETSSNISVGFANVFVGTLSFKAMAPIVLVHGWNEGRWVWGPKPATSICGVTQKNAMDGGQNFVQAIIDSRVPFDCTVKIDPQISSILGAGQLSDALKPILDSFGARHVNLVAHSKGGLFARKFLQDNALSDPIKEIGVISVTTLDTPHHGSVLADTVVNFNNSLLGGFMNAALQVFQSVPGFIGLGANDLTVKGVRTFNDLFLQPPPQFRLMDSMGNSFITNPFYYSTSADADLDGNGTISSVEANPYPQLFGNLSYYIVARRRPVNVFQAAGLLHANVSSLSDPIKNDLLVSIDSAQYIKFTQIASLMGVNGRNHSTIRCGIAPECSTDIAPFVLQQIRNAEMLQPVQ
jgi:triacylglycerol esterase/lipase EstA (alpha/beta hydrolase family)